MKFILALIAGALLIPFTLLISGIHDPFWQAFGFYAEFMLLAVLWGYWEYRTVHPNEHVIFKGIFTLAYSVVIFGASIFFVAWIRQSKQALDILLENRYWSTWIAIPLFFLFFEGSYFLANKWLRKS